MRRAKIESKRVGRLAAVILGVVCAISIVANADDAVKRPSDNCRKGIFARFLEWPKNEVEKDKGSGKEGENGDDKTDEGKDEEEPLESDRPDFTEASTTVGAHRLQLEGGYKYTHTSLDGVAGDRHDLPELLLRYGLAERLELRVAWDEGMIFQREKDLATGNVVSQDGSTDVEVGFKYAITQQDKWLPRTAIIVACTAPTGSPLFSSRQVDANVNYLYSWEFNKKLSLNCSTGNTWTAESGDRFSKICQAMSLEYELTKKLHAFSEWAVFLPVGAEDHRAQHYYDGGFTYLVTPNLQLDWSAGVGLSEAADRFFTGCGVSVRW
jgi:hypothetical protein